MPLEKKAPGQHATQAALVEPLVDEAQIARQRDVEEDPSHRGLDERRRRRLVFGHREVLRGDPQLDLGVQMHRAVLERQQGVGEIRERSVFAQRAVNHLRQVIGAERHVLGRRNDGRAVRRRQHVERALHNVAGLVLRGPAQRHVHRHLVTVEVGVEGRAHQRVDLNRAAGHQHDVECLDAEPVQRRGAVQQHRVVLRDFRQRIPHHRLGVLHHALGALDVAGMAVVDQLAHDKRLEELQRHLGGQAALVQLQVRTDHDHRPARIIHPLAQQVLAEPPLLAAELIAQRLVGVVGRAGDSAPASAVVDQRIHGLLEHALLIAHDDLGRAEIHQPLEPVVPVDHAAVEVVQVAGREPAAVELHHGPDVRRQHGQHRENHPLRAVARAAKRLDDLEALGGLLTPLDRRRFDLLAQLGGQGVEIDVADQLDDRLGPDAGAENLTAGVTQLLVARLAQQLVQLKGRQVVGALLVELAGARDLRRALFLQPHGFLVGLPPPRQLGGAKPLLGRGDGRLGRRFDGRQRLGIDLIAGGDDRFVQPAQADFILGLAAAFGNRREACNGCFRLFVQPADLTFELLIQLGDLFGRLGLQVLRSLGHLDLDLRLTRRPVVIDPSQRRVTLGFVELRDDERREVDDLLQIARGDVQDLPDPTRRALQEPDVGHGGGELDVAHALAPHARAGDLHAALVADDAAIADLLVLAARALPVLRGTEDALAEQPVALRLERSIVDGLRLDDLAVRPRPNLLRRCEADADCVELVDFKHARLASYSRYSRP